MRKEPKVVKVDGQVEEVTVTHPRAFVLCTQDQARQIDCGQPPPCPPDQKFPERQTPVQSEARASCCPRNNGGWQRVQTTTAEEQWNAASLRSQGMSTKSPYENTSAGTTSGMKLLESLIWIMVKDAREKENI